MNDQHARSDRAGLAESLRALRSAAGLNQTELAARTGLSQSQISRAEKDRRLLSPENVAKFANACGAGPAERDRLVQLAEVSAREFVDSRAILQRGRGAHFYQERVRRLEEDSALVRAYQPGMVLGQLQSPSYARAVMRIREGRPEEEVDQLVEQRMQRSNVLRTEPARRWELLQTEGSLTWCLDSPSVMIEQIEHLIEISNLPNVDVGIVPAYRRADFLAVHGFHIYDADAVHVGTTTATALLELRDDVDTYAALFSRIAQLAVHGDDARAVLTRIADHYRSLGD